MRFWLTLISFVTMLLVVSACGGDDDESDASDSAADDVPVTVVSDEPTETEEPEPTATPSPEPTPEPEPTPSPTEESDGASEDTDPADDDAADDEGEKSASDDASSGDLNALLLSVDDLPGGWTEAADVIDAEAELGDITNEPFQAPCGVEPLEEVLEPRANADRNFQWTEFGPYLNQDLAQFGSPDEAAEIMGTVRTLFECDEWIETDEFGGEMTFTLTESDIQDVGDDALALDLGLSLGEEPELEMFGEFGFDLVFLQRNEFISILMYIDPFGMSETDVPALVRLADEKLQ